MIKSIKWLLIAMIMAFLLFIARNFLHKDSSLPKQHIPIIGVIQAIDHCALDQTRQGILDELKDNGFEPSTTMQWVYESAQGNPVLVTQIIQKFISQKVDLILTIGTTPSQAAVQLTQSDPSIPIIFSSVTDPISAKLLTNPQSPEANITGVSNFIEVEKQLDVFKKILIPLKKLGLIYNPGEANSVTLIKKTQEAAQELGIQLILTTANKTSEVLPAVQSLIGKVDAIFINNDNTALAAFEAIGTISQEHNLPVFVSDIDFIKKGALAALGPDQRLLGRQTGKMVLKILKEKKSIGEIPVEGPERPTLKIDFEKAKQFNIHFGHHSFLTEFDVTQ